MSGEATWVPGAWTISGESFDILLRRSDLPRFQAATTAPNHTPTEREAGDVGEVAAKVITISPVEWGDLIRNAQANAWDEGWQEAWSPMSMHNRDDGPNPYRQTREVDL